MKPATTNHSKPNHSPQQDRLLSILPWWEKPLEQFRDHLLDPSILDYEEAEDQTTVTRPRRVESREDASAKFEAAREPQRPARNATIFAQAALDEDDYVFARPHPAPARSATETPGEPRQQADAPLGAASTGSGAESGGQRRLATVRLSQRPNREHYYELVYHTTELTSFDRLFELDIHWPLNYWGKRGASQSSGAEAEPQSLRSWVSLLSSRKERATSAAHKGKPVPLVLSASCLQPFIFQTSNKTNGALVQRRSSCQL